jgi:hypothetical protein
MNRKQLSCQTYLFLAVVTVATVAPIPLQSAAIAVSEQTSQPLYSLRGHIWNVSSVAFTPDG